MVVHLGAHDEKVPEVNLTVTIRENGNSQTTNSQGLFRIMLPETFKPGDKVTLLVDKPDWRIHLPVEGETRVPADLRDVVEVRLLPVGSPLFLSPTHLEKLGQDIAEKSKQQLTPENKPVDFTPSIKDYTVKFGFGIEQVQEELARWQADVKATSNDLYKLGLAAFLEKNFLKACQLSNQAGTQQEKRLAAVEKAEESLKKEKETLVEEIVRAFRLEGDSHANNYRFDDALSAYQRALSHVSKTHRPQDWAATLNDIGTAHWQRGLRSTDMQIHTHLTAAVTAYRQALEVYTRTDLLQGWAMTQNNLGNALERQGERTAGERGTQLLAEGVTAYRQALEVYTRTDLPQGWATTQNNLGNALQRQGERTAGERGTQLLAEAVTAYRQALEVRTFATLPLQWAQTHNNLAKVLVILQDWSNAVISYVNVLRVYPDDEDAYQAASALYHDQLFQFPQAFSVNQQWLERHPDDLDALSDFAEKHLTTGRFAECAQRLTVLLANSEVTPPIRLALQALEIANLLALDQAARVPGKIDIMLAALDQQPEDFRITWSFGGTLHFISQHASLTSYRHWLQQFFDVLTAIDRQTLVTGLHAAQASFPAGVK
jgi:tetratricopeptide (TPR) repeat protein